jgi:hypothetical protein
MITPAHGLREAPQPPGSDLGGGPLVVGRLAMFLSADHGPDNPVTRPAGGDAAGAVETFDVVEVTAGTEQQRAGTDDHGADGKEKDEHEHGTTTAQSGE